MKSFILALTLLHIGMLSFSQKEELLSVSRKIEDKVKRIDRTSRTVYLSNKVIKISNSVNEDVDTLTLSVDKLEYKKYEENSEDLYAWYYCTSTTKEPIVGFAKYILVIPVIKDKVEVYKFFNEVNVAHSTILVKNIVK